MWETKVWNVAGQSSDAKPVFVSWAVPSVGQERGAGDLRGHVSMGQYLTPSVSAGSAPPSTCNRRNQSLRSAYFIKKPHTLVCAAVQNMKLLFQGL